MGDVAVQSLWFIGAFVLVLSGLIARRLPLSDWLKFTLAWVAIFSAVFLLVTLWKGAS